MTMCHAARHHHVGHVRAQQGNRVHAGYHAPLSREERQREFVQRASKFGAVFVLCVGIWIITGFGAVWPLWVLLIGGFVLAREARDAYGSYEDEDEDEDADLDDVDDRDSILN